MKKKIRLTWKHLLPIVLLVALLGTGVYAWIYGMAPKISGSMRIGSTGSLNFVVDNNKTGSLHLNKAFGVETKNLNLNEVSSADGKTFFARNLNQYFMESYGSGVTTGQEKEIITFREAQPDDAGNDGDYLDVSFKIQLDTVEEDTNAYYIYFLNGTMDNTEYSSGFSRKYEMVGTEDGLRALRVCLRVSGAAGYSSAMQFDSDTEDTYWGIFGNQSELGIAGKPFRTAAVAETETVSLREYNWENIENKEIAGDYTIVYLQDITEWPHRFGVLNETLPVYGFGDCGLNPTALGNVLSGDELPNENYLFMLDYDHRTADVTMRVWLEGGSASCVNSSIVPEQEINLGLYFIAFSVPSETEPTT